MKFSKAIEKIDSLLVFGSRPGLDRIQKLLGLMGDPQDRLKFVHVAGTNGKGSVCFMLSEILTAAGYKTGLFTSPHIVSFCERMMINGKFIPEEDVASLTEELFPLAEKLREQGDVITEFEFVAAMAFEWFARSGCDVVVLETGMGGRFDATNVIKTPLCSVITSISLDHTAILGDTVEKIAFEKCGIIKEGGRTVYMMQEKAVDDCVIKCTKERGGILHSASAAVVPLGGKFDLGGSDVMYADDTPIRLPLPGRHQLRNTGLVFAAVDALRAQGLAIDDKAVKRGIENVKLPARVEVVSSDPIVIIDGSHNPAGMIALRSAVNTYLRDRKIMCVMGMLADKDCREAASSFIGLPIEIMATRVPDSPRAQSGDALKETLIGIGYKAEACEDPFKAADIMLERTKQTPGSVFLLCGSLYLAAALRPYIYEKTNGEA